MAVARFHENLTTSGNPALLQFADHIRKHILVPSRRYAAPGHRQARSGLAGSFTYEPQPGVAWT